MILSTERLTSMADRMLKKEISVLVVDDSAFSRRTITKMLEKIQNVTVVGTSADGEDAIKKVFQLKPDLVTLDLEMPKMDGFTFLRIVMTQMPTPVLVVSSLKGNENVFKALELGAADFILKPTQTASVQLLDIENELIRKVVAISQVSIENLRKMSIEREPKPSEVMKEVEYDEDVDVIAIGASTGGPTAVQYLLEAVPEKFPTSFIVSQHMPEGFTKSFAERLNKNCKIAVKEAEKNDRIQKGIAFIAPGGYHMKIKKDANGILIDVLKKSSADKYTPSVDIMFSSAAEALKNRLIGIVLTGMGNDGKKGVCDIKENGGVVIAESKDSAVVYGMPFEAVKTGTVDKVIHLKKIREEIINIGNLIKKRVIS